MGGVASGLLAEYYSFSALPINDISVCQVKAEQAYCNTY